jgi:hypothetical protein
LRIVVTQFATTSIHFAASLELLEVIEESENIESHYFLWGNKTFLPNKMALSLTNLSNKVPKRYQIAVKEAGYSAFSENFIFDRKWVDKALKAFELEIPNLKNLDDLQKIEIEGIYPGGALANELISIVKDRNVDLRKNSKLLKKLARTYFEVFNATEKVLFSIKPNSIYVFNGRFLRERAVRDCAKKFEFKTLLFETTRDRFQIRELGFHDRSNNQTVMREVWNSSPLPLKQKIEIGSKYFIELRSKANPFITSRTILRDQLDLNSKYFAYFSNSDDESVGFWESWKENLGRQIDCVRELQKIFDNQDHYKLIIRLHPNLKNKSEREILEWKSLKATQNSIVIDQNSQISSYEILDNSVGVISFGSTIGLEAAFKFKPSLLLADSGYDELQVSDKATEWSQVIKWIQDAPSYSSEFLHERYVNSCKRGFYLASAGFNFKNSKLENVGWGAWDAKDFKGIKIDPSRIELIFKKVIFFIKWKVIA